MPAEDDDPARAAATATPPGTLAALGRSPDPAVRRAVIHNPATPRDVLLELAVTDWWEVNRRPDGEGIILERISLASSYGADLFWLRELRNLQATPASIKVAIAAIGWMEEFPASGPEDRRMMRSVAPASIDDIDD
jgi:hypothetical protein